jgi:hypothetical protein
MIMLFFWYVLFDDYQPGSFDLHKHFVMLISVNLIKRVQKN